MAKSLVIVESPAKAATLGKFLGKDFTVMACYGHVRDLQKKGIAVDREHGYAPSYEILPGKERTVQDLKKAAKSAETIYLAADPDREGEAICWHLQEILKPNLPKTIFHRAEFHEITKAAVTHAVSHPGVIDQDRVNAQQARRIIDRLVGYEVSDLLWLKLWRGLSAGRVQTVTLRIIVERESERERFVPVPYFSVPVTLRKGETAFPHFQAPAGRGAHRLQRPPHDADRAKALRGQDDWRERHDRPHHIHAHGLDALGRGGARRRARLHRADLRVARAPRGDAALPAEEGRPGRPRGHPPHVARPPARSRRPVPGPGRAEAVPTHLESVRGLPDEPVRFAGHVRRHRGREGGRDGGPARRRHGPQGSGLAQGLRERGRARGGGEGKNRDRRRRWRWKRERQGAPPGPRSRRPVGARIGRGRGARDAAPAALQRGLPREVPRGERHRPRPIR